MITILWKIFLTIGGTALLLVVLSVLLLFTGTGEIKKTTLEVIIIFCDIWNIHPNDLKQIIHTRANTYGWII